MKFRFILTALAAALLSGCGVVPDTDSTKKEAVVVSGNSQFTPDGIDAIKSSGKVAFDFTRLPMDMSALGFPAGSDGALVAADSGRLIDVTMTTPQGVVGMQTDTIRIRPGADNTVDHIDIFVNYPDAQDANAEIERAADELGFVALFTDGEGAYWFRVSRGFHTALNESLASLECLADEIGGPGKSPPEGSPAEEEDKRLLSNLYRRLQSFFE